MKDFTVTHACPVLVTRKWGPDLEWDADDQPCEGDVILTYDVGKGPDEMYLQEDSPTCANGHEMTEKVLSEWWTEDYASLAGEEQDRSEEAYWTHVNSQIDKALGK